jgi:inositol oxygenase
VGHSQHIPERKECECMRYVNNNDCPDPFLFLVRLSYAHIARIYTSLIPLTLVCFFHSLLFRSDKPGAIAKIIYSSEIEDKSSLQSSVTALQNTAQAKIHVLDVKSQYRGSDLGGLLFSEAITHLRSKYCNNDDDDDDNFDVNEPLKSEYKQKQLYDVNCVLEAEEDVSRHGKLIEFYKQLGCQVITCKRVQYINDNDFAYRKVPMQVTLRAAPAPTTSKKRKRTPLLCKTSFLPVQLVGDAGKLLVKSSGASEACTKFEWLITQADNGIQFCSTHGHLLVASPQGHVTILSPDDQTSDSDSDVDDWAIFVPIHISDEIDRDGSPPQQDASRSLWVLRSCHGTFLTADSVSKCLSCTKLPSFWQANGSNLSLVCTSDTPPRRHHYLQCWRLQTYEYVHSMRSRFLNFSLQKATIFDALGWIHKYPAYPFHAWSCDDTIGSSIVSSPSLRTLSFLMAEAARDEGLPDWIQLVALFHELGEAVKVLDPINTGAMADTTYDWTISTRSRLVGCKIPDRASFSEFRHFNPDTLDAQYSTDTGVYESNCGLDNALLMWSGPEYMYHLLRHNHTALPVEALAMIRYFLLGDWHEHHEYTSITNEHDDDMLPWVSDFDRLRRKTRLECLDCIDLSDEQCSYLWDSHYSRIAAKYDCDHLFEW